jgi:hypothetical protein
MSDQKFKIEFTTEVPKVDLYKDGVFEKTTDLMTATLKCHEDPSYAFKKMSDEKKLPEDNAYDTKFDRVPEPIEEEAIGILISLLKSYRKEKNMKRKMGFAQRFNMIFFEILKEFGPIYISYYFVWLQQRVGGPFPFAPEIIDILVKNGLVVKYAGKILIDKN